MLKLSIWFGVRYTYPFGGIDVMSDEVYEATAM